MRILNLANYFLSASAWIICSLMVLSFTAGVFPDIDHPLAFWLGIRNGRFMHPYFNTLGYILLGCGVILTISSFCRFARVRFLKIKGSQKEKKPRVQCLICGIGCGGDFEDTNIHKLKTGHNKWELLVEDIDTKEENEQDTHRME